MPTRSSRSQTVKSCAANSHGGKSSFSFKTFYRQKNTPFFKGVRKKQIFDLIRKFIFYRKGTVLSCPQLSVCEAVAAINGAVVSRLKGNFTGFSASGAHSVIHLAGSLSCIFARIAAVFAAGRFVGKSLFGVEFLFTGCENKFLSTVSACECLVFVQISIPLLIRMYARPLVRHYAYYTHRMPLCQIYFKNNWKKYGQVGEFYSLTGNIQ